MVVFTIEISLGLNHSYKSLDHYILEQQILGSTTKILVWRLRTKYNWMNLIILPKLWIGHCALDYFILISVSLVTIFIFLKLMP